MPKMKTKSGAKKRFKTTASGKIKAKKAYRRHMMMNKPKKMKREARGLFVMHEGDADLVRYWLPYSRKKKSKAVNKAAAAEGGK